VRRIGFFRFEEVPFGAHPLRVARTGWSKQGGFEIYLDDSSLGPALWDAIMAAGSDLGVRPGCPNLIERIEGGLLSYGGDLDRTYNPFECGFDRFVHLDRDIEFLGRPALERIAVEGPTRRIVGLLIDGDSLPSCRNGWSVTVDGEPVGRVTSAVFSPSRNRGVAIATVDVRHASPATDVVVQVPGDARRATVGELPFAV
jgi:dimethylsulfoniopropionate demethylase